MLKTRRRKVFALVGVSLTSLALGAMVSAFRQSGVWSDRAATIDVLIPETLDLDQKASAVEVLANVPPSQRATQLEQLSQKGATRDRVQAKYVLAADRIAAGRAGSALPLLDGLENDYPLLAPHILAKRAQAYAASGDAAKANETWETLIKEHSDDPAAAEALFALGQADPARWQQLVEKFPGHPHSIEVAQKRLQQNPNDLSSLLLLAHHGLYLSDIGAVLDRLMNEFEAQLTPEDWQAIAFGYWELGRYGSAGYAYGKAPATPLNLYRTGRGAQLGERSTDAIAAYQRLIQTFPDAEETSLALLRLSRLVSSPETALTYVDQVIARFPDDAAEALVERANILERLNSPQSASQARQSVLSQYSQADAAAELRWTLAEQRFEAQDIAGAWELARQIVADNPTSELAPEAAFWVGKWALELGQTQDAQAAFEHVLTHYPQSYYAWRSATYLGWQVGDFTTVRLQDPGVVTPTQRPVPPSGSPILKELYRLGQDQDAWARWQVEFSNRMESTVAEQFTDGLMRLGVGDNLDGIFMISNLQWRDKKEDQQDYQALKQQSAYWQALYPFPFVEPIRAWSQQRQLNPLLVTGLIRQESRFEPEIVSSAGAKGLMQVMPGTADWISTQINLAQFDLGNPDDNIKLGTWYLDYTHREYADNSLFAVASYNAGPGNVANWITRFGFSDPDAFVEQIPFPETKQYVESVFENYWNYLRLYNPEVSAQLAQLSPDHATVVGFKPGAAATPKE